MIPRRQLPLAVSPPGAVPASDPLETPPTPSGSSERVWHPSSQAPAADFSRGRWHTAIEEPTLEASDFQSPAGKAPGNDVAIPATTGPQRDLSPYLPTESPETSPTQQEWTPAVAHPRTTLAERRRKRDGSNAVVGVLLALFALAGMFEVVNGESSTNSNPNRFATSSSSTTVPPVTTPCIETPLAAVRVLSLLRATQHFPVAVKTSQSDVAPAGSCNEVAFADRRGQGLNRLIIYPTSSSAASAAASAVNSTTLSVGRVVIDFDRSLTTYEHAYQVAVGSILAAPVAHTQSTSVAAGPLPS